MNSARLTINRRLQSKNVKRKIFLLTCILPFLVSYCINSAYPVFTTVYSAFCKWNYTNMLKLPQFDASKFFDNFSYLFTVYPYFKEILINSFMWMAVGIFLQVPFTVLVTLFIAKKAPFWKAARNIFVIPNVISSAAMGIIFVQLYDPKLGIINDIIKIFNPSFAGNILLMQGYAFWGIVFSYFFFVGTTSLMLLGQIFAIPNEVFESARIDGAGSFKTTFFITLPLIKGMIGTIMILAGTSGFIIFDNIMLLTKGAGKTLSFSYAIRSMAFMSEKMNFGRANALALVQFFFLITINGVITLLFKPGKSDLKG